MSLKLSYSGMTCLQDCERKYVHRYVMKSKQDTDFETPNYFDFGSAFHKILELTSHEAKNFSAVNFEGIIKSYESLDYIADGGRIAALLRNYWLLHGQIPLFVAACELRLDLDKTTAVIDAIAVDKASGEWWIVDLKTTGMIDATLPARISRDPQLNHYAACAPSIAKLMNLDLRRFAGVRYREGFKCRVEPKDNETFEKYTARVQPNSKIREIVVASQDLKIPEVWESFMLAFETATRLTNEANAGRCNYNSCLKWGRPCEYFSQCYGRTFTEAQSQTIINTHEIIDKRDPALFKAPQPHEDLDI
jgi:hypothetical protein